MDKAVRIAAEKLLNLAVQDTDAPCAWCFNLNDLGRT